jgi:hypothetical protein
MHVQRVTSIKICITSSRYNSHNFTAYTFGRNDVIFAGDRNQKWLISAAREKFWDDRFLI